MICIADIKSVGGYIARAELTMRGRKLSDEKWFILYSRIKGFGLSFGSFPTRRLTRITLFLQ